VTPLLRFLFNLTLDEGTYLTSIMIRLLFYRAKALEWFVSFYLEHCSHDFCLHAIRHVFLLFILF
jgi:hypothetical protein